MPGPVCCLSARKRKERARRAGIAAAQGGAANGNRLQSGRMSECSQCCCCSSSCRVAGGAVLCWPPSLPVSPVWDPSERLSCRDEAHTTSRKPLEEDAHGHGARAVHQSESLCGCPGGAAQVLGIWASLLQPGSLRAGHRAAWPSPPRRRLNPPSLPAGATGLEEAAARQEAGREPRHGGPAIHGAGADPAVPERGAAAVPQRSSTCWPDRCCDQPCSWLSGAPRPLAAA